MKEEFCCNCHWYDGVHGRQGCAECKIKHEIVLWSDCCDHLWLIPKRLKIGLKTNADRTDDLLKFAKWVAESVCVSDNKWEKDCWKFQKIAFRMLVMLGIMEENDGVYSLKQEGE